MDVCYTGIHNCIIRIQSYTGTQSDITRLQSAIHDAEKVTPDYQYRNFVVASRFYDLGAYRASALMAEEIIKNRPDYAGVEKLLGFSLARIGNLSSAKTALLATLERDPKDLDTIVELGNISLGMGDYTVANLYYNNAILGGYTPKTSLERKLAYSYSRLSDTQSMLTVLAYLLAEPDVSEDDITVAVSLALERGENLKAYVWASNAIKKYPNSEKIAAIYLTSMRTIGRKEAASEYINTLTGSIAKSPIVLLERGILLMDAGDDTGALDLFHQVRDIDPVADFGVEATNYITILDAKKQSPETLPVPTNQVHTNWWQ